MPALPSSPEPVAPPAKSVVRVDSRTGRLVREMVSPKASANPADQVRMAEIIDKVAAEQGVEGPLVHSVARVESNYNALAISSKGARGVMQLEPETARRFGVLNSFDPEQNVRGGVKYLKFLLSYYQGDYTKAVAAYNAGEKAVDRYRGIPPYAETVDYVARVSKNLKTAREKTKKNPPPDAATRTAETYRPIQTSVGSDGRIYYRTP